MIGQLAANFPGSTWDAVPKGCFNYGAGGVNAWRSICGGPNGGSALLAQLGAPTAVKDEYNAWYEKNAFPSNAAYVDYASGTWTPGGTATGGWGSASNQLIAPRDNAPVAKPESLLCHASHGRWLKAAGGEDGYWVRTFSSTALAGADRCSKLVYDCVFKLCELINAWQAGTLPAGTLDPSATATGCMAAGCHTAPDAEVEVAGKMKCTDSCHK
ncbi:MAG: hypothetical protein WBI63_07505 [Coriobacteriia bacterium]